MKCAFAGRDKTSGQKYACTLPAGHEGKHRITLVADGRSFRPAGKDWGDEACTEGGCSYKAVARGLCPKHHRARREAGTLPAKQTQPPAPFRSGTQWNGNRQGRPRAEREKIPDDWNAPLREWLDHLKIRGLRPQTIEMRLYHLRYFAREVHRPPFEVTLRDLTDWIGRHEGWARSTSSSVRASLRQFYKWAEMAGHIAKSPAENLPGVKIGPGRPNPVPDTVYKQALAEADPKVALMIRLAGELGMRRAEVAQVHRDDVIESEGGPLLRIDGKGGRERIIPMGKKLAQDLIAWIDAHGGNGFAFPGPGQAGHLTPHFVGNLVSRALGGDWTMHKLRHRALTRVHDESKDLILTAALAGHSSVSTTANYYVKPDYTALRGLVEGIAS